MNSPGVGRTIREWASQAGWGSIAALKNAVVSDQARYLKVRVGPARGAILHTSYRYGSRKLFGIYESEVVPYLRRYVRPGDACYDVGASGGYFAFAFARCATPGQVDCFDIDEQSVEQLKALTARNTHLGSLVRAHWMRIGDVAIDDTNTSLDALVYDRGWKRPDVIKLDVEGDELNVLHGALRVLREYHPKLIVEVHSASLEEGCLRLLQRVGYSTTIVKNRPLMGEGAFRRIALNRWLCAERR